MVMVYYRYQLKKDQLNILLTNQQQELRKTLRNELVIYSTNWEKEKRSYKKWGDLYYIYKTLQYLELKDLLNILSVNKEWRKRFNRKICRVIFDRYGQILTSKQRNCIWLQLIQPVKLI